MTIGKRGGYVSLTSTLTVRVIKQPTRCRSTNYLTLVEVIGCRIVPAPLAAAATAAESTSEAAATCCPLSLSMTAYLAVLRWTLKASGHSIVGDEDVVKKSKGLNGYVSKVRYSPLPLLAGTGSADGVTPKEGEGATEDGAPTVVAVASQTPFSCSVGDPTKFEKLLSNEERMWDKGADKTASELVLLEAHTDADADGDGDAIGTAYGRVETSGQSDVPVAYRVGHALFCGFRFMVNPEVMIPRVSSEVLVKAAVRLLSANGVRNSVQGVQGEDTDMLSAAKRRRIEVEGSSETSTSDTATAGDCVTVVSESGPPPPPSPARVLDLGTGSGCLLLSIVGLMNGAARWSQTPGEGDLQHESTGSDTIAHNPSLFGTAGAVTGAGRRGVECKGVGVDISPGALTVAAGNAEALGLKEHTAFTSSASFSNLSVLLPQELKLSQQTSTAPDAPDACAGGGEQPPHTPPTVADTMQGNAAALEGDFQIIVCNPPYSTVKEASRCLHLHIVICTFHKPYCLIFCFIVFAAISAVLSTAVREHEPALALFAPPNAQGSHSPICCYEMF